MSGTEEIYHDFYTKWIPILFFILVPPLLGTGSLLQERGYGTVGLSLSLPVTRLRIVCVRIALGMLEFTALCLVPAVLIPVLSLIEGDAYPFSSAFHFAVVWIVCGAALFAASFLFSTVLAGQYAAATASVVTILTYYTVTTNSRSLFRFSMEGIIVGMGGPIPGNPPNGLPGALPWLDLSLIATIALALLATAAQITRWQDF